MKSCMVAIATTFWLLTFAIGQTQPTQAAAPAPDTKQVAGRTIEQYAAMLDDESRVAKLRAAKSLGAFGPAAGDALRKALASDDVAVQYTAAVHLGRIGGEPLQKAIERLKALRHDDRSPAVQQAAAFALARAGQADGNVDLLIQRLDHPDRGMALCATDLLGLLGKQATPAIEKLQKLQEQNPENGNGDHHRGSAAGHALMQIQGDSE